MQLSLSFLALAAASAVSATVLDKRVVYLEAPAVKYTAASTAFCLDSANGVPSYLITRSQNAINAGYYVAIPGPINATDCALSVGVINAAGTQIVATLVDTTTDGTVKLSSNSWSLIASSTDTTIDTTYFVSNAG